MTRRRSECSATLERRIDHAKLDRRAWHDRIALTIGGKHADGEAVGAIKSANRIAVGIHPGEHMILGNRFEVRRGDDQAEQLAI